MALPDTVSLYHTPAMFHSVLAGKRTGHGNMKVSGVFVTLFLLLVAEQAAAAGHPVTETLGDLTFECEHGWSIHKGNCYKAIDVPMIYDHAALTCLGQGAFLYYADNEIEYFEHVAEILPKTIWFELRKIDGTWKIGEAEVPLEFIFAWGNGQPDEMYDHAAVDPIKKLMLTSKDEMYPFVCKRRACRQGYMSCDLASKCIPVSEQVCNGLPECTDGSDENNCPAYGTSYERLTEDSGSIATGSFSDFEEKTWWLEAPVGKRIRLDLPTMSLESNVLYLEIWTGGPTYESSEMIHSFTGFFTEISLFSSTNFLAVRMYATDLSANVASNSLYWTTSIPQIPDGVSLETATSSWDNFWIPFRFDRFKPMYLQLWWRIDAPEGMHIFYYLEAFPEDGYTEDKVDFKITAENFDDDLDVLLHNYYVSFTNVVHVKSYHIPQNGGIRLNFKLGCDFETSAAFGTIRSSHPIPNDFECSWRLTAGQAVSRGMSLRLDQLDLAEDPRTSPPTESEDKLMIYPDQTATPLNGFVEGDILHASGGVFNVEIMTDAAFISDGFAIGFGRDCEELDLSEETILSTDMTYIYEDVTLSCPDGYTFHTQKYKEESSVTLTCYYDGWKINGEDPGVIPECRIVYCGPPTKIENGGVVAATAVTYEGIATYQCNEGFSPNDPQNATCDATGSWVDVPSCTSFSCGALSPNFLLNGVFEVVKGNAFDTVADFGVILGFTCNDGYELHGPDISLCVAEGWTHESNPPSCERIVCALPDVPNLDIPPAGLTTKTEYEGELLVSCSSNYRFTHVEASQNMATIKLVCEADGEFVQSPSQDEWLVCGDIDECEENSDSCDLSSTTCHNIDGDYLCICKDGFARVNDFVCEDIKECSDDNGGCSMDCVEEEGSYHCDCDDGYVLFEENGDQGFFHPAGEDGFRQGDRYFVNHTCVPVQCPPLPVITNGKFLTEHDSFNFMDTVILQCNDGYKVNETGITAVSFTSTCQNDGTWDELFACEARNCILPTKPEYGEFDKTSVMFKETVTLTCNLTEVRKTERRAVCLYEEDGVRFAGDDITKCPEIDCGDPELSMPAGGNFLAGGPSTTTYFGAGSSFTFTCDDGFDVTGASSNEDNDRNVECKENSRWNFGTLACTGKMCEDPGTPGDAIQISTGYDIGSTLYYTCNRKGFTIDGHVNYTCEYNAQTDSVAWSNGLAGNLPECKDTLNPIISGDCGKTIDRDANERVNFIQGFATDNFNIAEWSASNFIQTDDRLLFDTPVTYTATDWGGNSETCTIEFNVIDRSDKPPIACPDSKTVEISSSDEFIYNSSLDVTAQGQALFITPTIKRAGVGEIGTANIISAVVYNTFGTESSCTFMVHFVANACFEKEFFGDRNANRVCTGDLSNLVCTSTCNSGYLFFDKTNEKNFTCTGTGNWNFRNVDAHERFCLDQQNPEYEVEIEVMHSATTPTVGCNDAYKSALEANTNQFENAIALVCNGMRWDISVLTAFPGPGLFELTSTLKLTLSSLGYTLVEREDCIAALTVSSDVFGNVQVQCPGGTTLVPGQSVTISSPAQQGCSNPAYELVDDTCLSCGPAEFYNSEANVVEFCPDGLYQDDLAQTSCKECPEGKYPNSDQTACQDTCPQGFRSDTGFYPCVPCPVNTYWTSATAACTPCDGTDSTVDREGQIDSSKCYARCPVGTFSLTGYDDDGCTDCPLNFYQDETGQLSCKECLASQVTDAEGSNSSSDCVPHPQIADCDSTYCNGNGQCRFEYHRRVCACARYYSGDRCQNMYHICDGNPCMNGATCVKGANPDEYNCTCRKDLDICEMMVYSETQIATQDSISPYRTFASTLTGCESTCRTEEQCKDASFTFRFNSGFCFLYSTELLDSQLVDEEDDNDLHMRKNCITAFDGEHCELDTDDNCLTAGCSENSQCVDKIGDFECICPSDGSYTGRLCATANNPCNPNPCDRGTCQEFGSVRYECTCQDGYDGLHCDHNIDECALHPDACSYGGTCNNLLNAYSCSCMAGFSGRNCENTPNFCRTHNCEGNMCYNSLNRMEGVCVCDGDLFEPRYRCEMTIAANSSSTKPQESIKIDQNVFTIDQCQSLCQENAECDVANYVENNGVFYCIHYNSSYENQAEDGVFAIFKNCDVKPDEAYACDKVNEPCDDVQCNNGTCFNVNNGLDHRCACDLGFTGSLCQHSINDCIGNVCQNGAQCLDGHQTYICSCAPGYEGSICADNIDDCPGSCNTTYGDCVDLVDGYRCVCNPGYTGENCDVEINECSSYPCMHGGDCIEMVNDYECNCQEGWEGDRCEHRVDNCIGQRTCLNGGECFSLADSSFCRCEGGATGENCEVATPLCDTLSEIPVCMNEGECVSTAGTAVCSCKPVLDIVECYPHEGLVDTSGGNPGILSIPPRQGSSITMETCKRTCLDIDECAAVTYSMRGNFRFCTYYTFEEEQETDDAGSIHFQKNCPSDYSGVSCECVKDWCAEDPCKYGGKCIPLGPVGYRCECEPGYSGPTCEVVADPCDSDPCRGRANCLSNPTEYICQCEAGKVWTGSMCKDSRTDYTLLVNALAGQTVPELRTPFLLDTDALSIMMRVRVHTYNIEQPLANLFSLVIQSGFEHVQSTFYDFSLTVTHEGVFVVYGSDTPVGVLFSEEYGNELFNKEWHYLGISINKYGILSMTIDAIHLEEPIDTGRNLSLNANAWIFLGYGYLAEYQLVEVYDTFLERSVFSRALIGERPDQIPVQDFGNFKIPPSTRLMTSEQDITFSLNPNLDVPALDCSEIGDIGYTASARLIPMNSITDLINILEDIEAANGGDLIYEHSVESILMSGYHPVIVTGLDKSTENYGECRFNLDVKYNDQCPAINTDNTVSANLCPLNGATNSVCDISCSTPSNRLAAPTPNYIVCGTLGVFDFMMPYADIILPSCVAPVPARYRLEAFMQFVLEIPYDSVPGDQLDKFHDTIQENFAEDASSDWINLCNDSSCSNLIGLDYSRNVLYTQRVNVVFSIELESITIVAVGGGEVDIVDALKAIILINKQLKVDKIAGAQLIESSVMISDIIIVCPNGHRVDESKDIPVCVPCSEGMYLDDGKCMPCDYGYYQNEMAQEQCKMCEGNTWTYQKHSKSSSDCKEKCLAGTYYDEDENKCKPCQRHFFQPEDGMNFCIPCGKEFKTIGNGSDSIADCKADCDPGEERSKESGLCEMCERGFWRSLDQDDCQPCLGDKTTLENELAETADDCVIDLCDLGEFFDLEEGQCTACESGYYQDEVYMLKCEKCPGNTTTRGPGSASKDDCEFYCAAGYEQNDTAEVCLMCERGFYKDNEGDTKFEACRQCPTFTTDMPGATSRDNCSIEICTRGEIIDDNLECDMCDIDTYSDEELPSTNTECIPCETLFNCNNCGRLYGTEEPGSISSDCKRYCPRGRYVIGDGCDMCARGYFKDNVGNTRFDNCTKCPNRGAAEMTTDGDGSEEASACNVYKCPAGSVHTETGCEECDFNYFQPVDHPVSTIICQPCQPVNGLTTNTINTGTVSPDECIPICDEGKYLEGAVCKLCPRGTFKDNIGNNRFGNCSGCPGDLTTEGLGAISSDLCIIPKCAAGNYLVNAECTACPPDTFSEVVNPNSQWECIPCPPINGVEYGTQTSGSDSSTLCEPICLGGEQHDGDECKECSIGFFKVDDDLFGDCVSCETVRPGFVTQMEGANSSSLCDLRDCPVGTQISGSSCTPCPEGEYQDEPRQDECKECGINLSTDGEGKTSFDDCQIKCGPGLQGITSCSLCPEGKIKPEEGYASCQDCPDDFTSNDARTVCDVVFCSIGNEYTQNENQEACEPCDTGFFKDEVGNDQVCQQCQSGTTTNGTGQASCDLLFCEKGNYELNSECVPCLPGTYKDIRGNQACTECAGQFTTGDVIGATSSVQCDTVLCPAGQFREPDQKTLCTACDFGTYQPDEGMTSCISCSDDEITLENEQISEDACVPECREGQQYNATTEICTLCPTGTFKESIGNVDMCQSCETDKTTAGPGSTSRDDCSENVCPPGTFYQIVNKRVLCYDCEIGRFSDTVMQAECTVCPIGFTTQAVGRDSELDCIDDCPAGEGYQTFESICEICPRGQYNNKQGRNPNSCKLCPSGRTNSQQGSVSCSFPAPPRVEQRIHLRVTVVIRVALDTCSDTDGISIILDRFLVLLKALFQARTDQRYNGVGRFCRGSNCQNLLQYSTPTQCREINNLKRAISHELEQTFIFEDISDVITDAEDENGNMDNIDTIEVIAQIFGLNGEDLSDLEREILFIRLDTIVVTDICGLGQELVNDTCTPCPAGEFGSAAGTCTQCGVNTYQDETGQTDCKSCEEFTSTENKLGSMSVDDCIPICQAGYEFDDATKTCSECEVGFYKDRAGNDIGCTACVDNRSTPTKGSTSENDCSLTRCVAGQYYFIDPVTQTIRCNPCGIGTFNPNIMAEVCERCPGGRTTQLVGSTSSGSCIDSCAPGTGYDTSRNTCLNCPRGQFNNATGSDPNTCKYCALGTTNFQSGQTSCDITDPGPPTVKRVVIEIPVIYIIAINNCGDADLNGIRTLIGLAMLDLFTSKFNDRYNGEYSYCSNGCANLFILFPNNNPSQACRARSSGRRKRALSHELDIILRFTNATDRTTDEQTGSSLPTEEVINQILDQNQDQLTPTPDQIVYGSAGTPQIQPVCNLGEQPVNNECVACSSGRYSDNGETCTLCPKDTYQDETGQSSCKDCPARTFFEGSGATLSSACGSWCGNNLGYCNNRGICSDTGRRTASCSCNNNFEGSTCAIKKEPESDLPAILGGAIGGGAALLFIILIAVGVIYRCSRGSQEKTKSRIHDPEYYHNGGYNDTYGNYPYDNRQVQTEAPYRSVGYPALGYKPDTSFEEGSYARAYKYRPSIDGDDRGPADETRFVWTA